MSCSGSADAQDLGRLLLLLKELIPEYNPGSPLLQAALTTPLSHAEPARMQSPDRQPETALSASLRQLPKSIRMLQGSAMRSGSARRMIGDQTQAGNHEPMNCRTFKDAN